jgi:hypothetical protein
MIFGYNQLDAQFFFVYVYFYSLHVSGSHVPIIRKINCINTTPGICHSENKSIIQKKRIVRQVGYLQILLNAHWGTLLVAQLVEALRYKSEGREFDSR